MNLLTQFNPALDEWVQFSPPVGKTLTGKIAATWGWENGVLYRWVFATTTSATGNDLYVLRIGPAENYGVWVPVKVGGVSSTSPIAASNSPTGSYVRVFARIGNGISMYRHASGSQLWPEVPIGQPSPYVSVCGTLAAAEGTINMTYRIYLFCTKANGTDDKLYIASGEGVTDNSFDWINRSTPAGQQLRNSGYALAATRRPDGGVYAIDAFLLTTSSELFFVKHTTTSGQITQIGDGALGSDRESSYRYGGMAAIPSGLSNPEGNGYAYGFYVGLGALAYRLYQRVGDNSIHFQDYDQESWANHQFGDPWHTVVPVSSENHAESSTALFKGRALTVAINHPGDGEQDFARVDGFWSNYDGDSWGGAVTMPNNGAQYVTDPTVDFMDNGTAYVLLLGQTFDNGSCTTGAHSASDVYWVTTTTGAIGGYVNHGAIDDSNDNDHPWLGVYRNPVGLDRVHAAWWDTENGAVKYRTIEENGVWGPIVTLTSQDVSWPVLTVGYVGETFVSWKGRICKIRSPQFDMCTTTPWLYSSGELLVDQGRLEIPPFEPTEDGAWIGGEHGFSLRASPTFANVVYLAYQRLDGDRVHKDVWFARLTYSGGNPPFTPSDPMLVASDEGTDQFAPAVSVVGMFAGGGDLVSVSWYDRRSPDGDCEGESNRCFRAKRAVSLDSGQTFVHVQDIPAGLDNPQTDPLNLPLHCRPTRVGARFLGEYHETTGDFLHSMQVVIGVPPLPENAESSGLFSQWISPGYNYWSQP